MSKDILMCDFCEEDYTHTPIIEKPSRVGYKGKVHTMPTLNINGRPKDNVCLDCLKEQIDISIID